MALLVLRSVGVVCRAKPNVPLVRWQKNKKMCVGQKLNLCLVSLSARFSVRLVSVVAVSLKTANRAAALRSPDSSEALNWDFAKPLDVRSSRERLSASGGEAAALMWRK